MLNIMIQFQRTRSLFQKLPTVLFLYSSAVLRLTVCLHASSLIFIFFFKIEFRQQNTISKLICSFLKLWSICIGTMVSSFPHFLHKSNIMKQNQTASLSTRNYLTQSLYMFGLNSDPLQCCMDPNSKHISCETSQPSKH